MCGTVPAWDPTIPENLETIRATIRRLRGWGSDGEDVRHQWYEDHGLSLTPATPRDRRIRGHHE